MKKIIPYLLLVIAIVVIDQLSKLAVVEFMKLYDRINIIPGFLDFYHTRNTGIAFSIGSNLGIEERKLLFKILPIGICIWVAREMYKEASQNKVLAVAFALILGGAIGNIIDRIRLDYVVDFISTYSNGLGFLPSWEFAIFNIADAAVSVGAVLIAYETIFAKFIKKKKSENVA